MPGVALAAVPWSSQGFPAPFPAGRAGQCRVLLVPDEATELGAAPRVVRGPRTTSHSDLLRGHSRAQAAPRRPFQIPMSLLRD